MKTMTGINVCPKMNIHEAHKSADSKVTVQLIVIIVSFDLAHKNLRKKKSREIEPFHLTKLHRPTEVIGTVKINCR